MTQTAPAQALVRERAPHAARARRRVPAQPVDLAAILGALPHAVVVADRDGSVRYANAAFQALRLDVDAGESLAEVCGAFGLPVFDTPAKRDARREFEADVQHPDGERWFQMRASFDHGLMEGSWIVSLIEITQRMQVERAHREHQAQLFYTSKVMSVGEMASVVAHELNHPLATCINFLAGAQRRIASAGLPELSGPLELARAQAERATQIVARIREFVRSREPKRGVVSVRELADSVLHWVRLDCAKHGITLRVELDDDLPTLWADRVMLEQVLVNLAKNAIEALQRTPPGNRRLTLGAYVESAKELAIWVGDSGEGIDEQTAHRLFTPFASSKSQGMGIGLSICRSIVEFHGGRLWYESEKAGGARFTFTLPTLQQDHVSNGS